VPSSDPNDTASIPVAKVVNDDKIFDLGSGSGYELDYPMRAGIISSLTNPNGNLNAIVPKCSSGECQFDEYMGVTHSTIGMCSKCVDARKYVFKTNDTYIETHMNQGAAYNVTKSYYGWKLPHGNGLEFTKHNIFLDAVTGNIDYAASDMPADVLKSSVANVSMAAIIMNGCTKKTMATGLIINTWFNCSDTHPDLPTLERGAPVAAATCSFYPCLRQYRGRVSKGAFSEELVNSSPAWFEFGIEHRSPLFR